MFEPNLLALFYAPSLLVMLANLIYLRRASRRTDHGVTHAPLVSIVIPARNEARNLGRLLPSLLSQDYQPFEIIVYDDASTDGTATVARSTGDPRITVLQGEGPPPGWIGKVHALYQATRSAQGDILLFLDADTALRHSHALADLISEFQHAPGDKKYLSGFTKLEGGGQLLVSMLPHTFLISIPIGLSRIVRHPKLSLLNGQCWMIERKLYLDLEPHKHNPDEILEDILIGRWLKARGVASNFIDLQRHVAVWMYKDLADAWQGFRKNAYLIMETPSAFLVMNAITVGLFLVLPVLSAWNLCCIYLLKFLSDRYAGFPLTVTILTPLTHLLTITMGFDSAIGHWRKNIDWKGRRVT